MATNPMQRKARNSFLLGMFLMLVIAAFIIGALIMVLAETKREQQELEGQRVSIYVLNTTVKSGQIITEDMLVPMTVLREMVPANAITDTSEFMNYSLVEKNTGAVLKTDTNGLYYEQNGTKIRVEEEGGYYYANIGTSRAAIEFQEAPLIAKVNMNANTALTLQMVSKSDEIASDDLRIQDLSMISLPIFLNVDDYIDIRLQFPDGQNYIVVSKKRVVDVQENTVWLKMTEEEIATMSNAIVEAYIMKGAKLYANLYVEPGLQADATPTYPPSRIVIEKMLEDPNIVEKAKTALRARYTQEQVDLRNNDINTALNQYAEEAQANVEEKIQEENETRAELRNKFLEGLVE